MPKYKHPKTGDVIETEDRATGVDLQMNQGYKPVPARAPQKKAEAKPAETKADDKPKTTEDAKSTK